MIKTLTIRILQCLILSLILVCAFEVSTFAEIYIDDASTTKGGTIKIQDVQEIKEAYKKSKMPEKTIDMVIYFNSLPINKGAKHEQEADKYYKNRKKFGKDCVLLYVNMYDRYVDVGTYGYAGTLIPSGLRDRIYREVQAKFKTNDFKGGCIQFIKVTDELTSNKRASTYYDMVDTISHCAIFVVSGFIFFVVFSVRREVRKTKGLKEVNKDNYIDRSKTYVEIVSCIFIRKDVHKTKIRTHHSSGGGGGGGHSGGHF